MKKITVKENEEFRVKVTTDFNENEFFYDAFVKARVETEFIVKDTVSYHRTKNVTMLDFSNNIIAFSGDRGQGKSSAMLSFSNLLNNCKKSPYREFLGNFLSEKNYVVLDRIDPTKLEDNDNILLIILGKIFNKFCNLWNNSDKNNLAQYSVLLEQFQLCYEEIITIKCSKESENSLQNALENLGRIGDSGNLKNDLWKLLEMFFDFENRCTNRANENEKNFLVIQLDDTDLNTHNSYKIVEDIRKYFMIPNVIVLMAIDISQLTKAIEQYFINKYKVYNEYYQDSHLIEHRKVAVKYIDKLIPGDRKIFLPKLDLITSDNAEMIKLEYMDDKDNNILSFKDSFNNDINDIQELIIRLIYEKTGIVFVKPKTYVHDIIPDTMRELVNFLSILNKMPTIKNSTTGLNDVNIRMDNLKKFETYFIEVWVPNNVHFRYQEDISNFMVASMATKNKQLIKDIKSRIQPVFIDDHNIENEESNSVYKIIGMINKIEKRGVYSLADIRTVLNAFEDEFPQEDTYKFIFAIKTLYTIYLSKIISSQLIHEKNDEPVDFDMLLDFLGGEIFSDDEINSFMRQEDGEINKGAYEIIATYSMSAPISLQRLILGNSPLLSFFLNFRFKSSQGKFPEYKRPYKLNNGARSTHFKYGAFLPIMKFLDPISSLRRLESRAVWSDERAKRIQNQCMSFVSNVDLINYIGKKLQNYSSMRNVKGEYCDHLVNLYERLNYCIADLHYLDLDINFGELISEIEMIRPKINRLFDIYKELDAEFDAKTIENRDGLSKYLMKLNMLRNTKNFEKLQAKAYELSTNLLSFNKWLKDEDLESFIKRLQALEEKLINLSGIMDSESRVIYQGEYNQILKELKFKFEDSMES